MKSVVVCGSMKFKKEILKFCQELTRAGVLVHNPYIDAKHDQWDMLSDEYKRYVAMGLTHEHFYKMRMADVVYVYNKDGYSGVSTTLEIGHAVALNKPIYALAHDKEICREVIFRKVISKPQEFIRILK